MKIDFVDSLSSRFAIGSGTTQSTTPDSQDGERSEEEDVEMLAAYLALQREYKQLQEDHENLQLTFDNY